MRAHVELSLADLIGEIVSDLGLTLEASVAGPIRQRLVQFRQSDFEMIAETAERSGLFFTLRGDTLHLLTLAGTGEDVTLTLGESLLEVRIEVNGDTACRTVSTTGWDPLRVEQHEGKAEAARSGRGIGIEIEPDQVGGSDERTIIDETLENDTQAEAIAQAEPICARHGSHAARRRRSRLTAGHRSD